MRGPLRRAVRGLVIAVLALSALLVLLRLHDLGRTRYFTVDEYQFGHAAWLVSQGQVPYVDFYEHHFPASYALHAPLVAGNAPFVDRALRLREAAFAWLLLSCLGLAVATGLVLRDPLAALLALQLPAAFGFSALSLVDFRADNLAGHAWLLCLLLLEVNRRRGSRGIAASAGVALALAVSSTQKLLLLGVAPLSLLLGIDIWRRRRGGALPFVRHPRQVLGAAAGIGALGLLAAAALGMLGPGFEATVRHAVAHESHYPEVRLAGYVAPFLAETALTTWPILAFALLGLSLRESRLYLLPLVAAVLAGLWMRGKFPYNYVFVCLLACLLAVRGYAYLVKAAATRWPAASAFAPLFYLLPLLVLPDQLGFAEGRTSNAHQLHVLAKLERFTSPGDVVIDDAGGALFRDHASHYYYHGPAHRAVLADYFEHQLASDLRESRAPFWIRDFRFSKLPKVARSYLLEHYVRADGWLYALGFAIPASGEAGLEREIEIVKAGTYHAWPAPAGIVARRGAVRGVTIDGEPVGPGGVALEEGMHRLAVAPGVPTSVVTPLPREVFLDRFERMRPYALLFEYERKPDRAWRDRTVLTP